VKGTYHNATTASSQAMCSDIVQTESESIGVTSVAGRATLLPTAGSRETRKDVSGGQLTSLLSESPTHTVVVATIKIQTAVNMGNIGHSTLEIMVDSSSSISLLAQSSIAQMTNIIEKPVPKILLKTASGVPLPTVKYITASVLIQNIETPVQHNSFVVRDLIAPAILGIDFLQHHSLVLSWIFLNK